MAAEAVVGGAEDAGAEVQAGESALQILTIHPLHAPFRAFPILDSEAL